MSVPSKSCYRPKNATLQPSPSATSLGHVNENIMNQFSRLARRAAIMLFVCAVSCGCATSMQGKTLDDTLKQYEIVIRWSQWDGAVDFLDSGYLERNPISRLDMDRLRLFRVTQYAIRSAIPFDEGMGLIQVVEIKLFNKNRAVERSLIDQQEWRYNAERERWFLNSGLPDVTKAR